MSYLRPDGKSQVTVQYEYGRPVRVDTVVISTQHADYIDQEQIRLDVIEHIIKPIIPAHLLDGSTKYLVNPTGRFVTGGPMGDAGLTGRKIIVDTYGGMARHGGGAFSGKDPTKVDRSAAYAARHIAKNIVAAGLADRLELQVAYAIGVARPLSLFVETFGTGKVSDEEILRLINEHFDLRPAAPFTSQPPLLVISAVPISMLHGKPSTKFLCYAKALEPPHCKAAVVRARQRLSHSHIPAKHIVSRAEPTIVARPSIVIASSLLPCFLASLL
jgi:hypothetical protein